MTDIKITTRELTKEYKPYGLEQNKKIAKMGGHTAKVARDDLEKNLGKTEITSQNNLNYQYINEIETKQLKDFVKKEKIIAKAMCVYFPFNHMHALESAEYNQKNTEK